MRFAFHTMRKFVTIFSLFKSKNFSVSLIPNSPRCSNQLHPNFRNLTQICDLSLSPLSSHRFVSTTAENPSTLNRNVHQDQGIDFPGGTVELIPEMKFISESVKERIPCYRVLDDNGQAIMGHNFVQVSEEVAVKMYTDMVTLRSMDTIFYEAQRQGRISFYVTAIGEEAINVASAAALSMDDVVFPQYREAGVLLWRGFTLQEFANQLFSNKYDNGKGRQMPAHYGSKKHNYFTIASTIA
ncbi:hypothetical protein ACSQ67_019361 [Phaseolus vulgaris]